VHAERTPQAAVSQPDDERELGTKAFLPVDTCPNGRHYVNLREELNRTFETIGLAA
jgi:hypothetical protein